MAHVGPELRRLHHDERNVAVIGSAVDPPNERIDRRSMYAGRLGDQPLLQVRGERDGVPHRPQATAEQRHVHHRRRTGAFPLQQSRGDTPRPGWCRKWCHRRRDRADRPCLHPPRRRDGGRGTGPAPEGGHVVAALLGFRTAGPERTAARVDDGRVHRADIVDVHTELPAVPRQEAGQEHIGAPCQFQEHLFTFGHRHIQAQTALPAIGMFDIRVGIALDAQRPGLTQTALRIARHRMLDLDHIGAPPLGQHRAGRRDEPVHGDFENANSVQRLAHYWAAGPITVANVLDSRNSSSPAAPPSHGRYPTA